MCLHSIGSSSCPQIIRNPTRLALLALFLALASNVPAASRFWDGSVDGKFSTAANWVSNLVPTNGDEIVFQANSLVARFVVTNDFTPNRAFTSILFQGSNYFVRGN